MRRGNWLTGRGWFLVAVLVLSAIMLRVVAHVVAEHAGIQY